MTSVTQKSKHMDMHLLFIYVFVYLYLNQNHELSITAKSYILDIVRFLDPPPLNARISLAANVTFAETHYDNVMNEYEVNSFIYVHMNMKSNLLYCI